MSEPWDKLTDESSKAYAAFCIYRDMGPDRSIDKVYKNRSRTGPISWLKQWSAKYNWIERAQAYDEYIEKLKRAEHEKEILEMTQRHAKLAMAFQQRVAQRLQNINPDELSPADMIRWLDAAAKLERLSRGEPTEIGKQEVRGEIKDGDIIERIKKYEEFFKTLDKSKGDISGDGIGKQMDTDRADD